MCTRRLLLFNLPVGARTITSACYNAHGLPKNVLELKNDGKELGSPKGNQVLLKMLAAPVHFHDLLAVKGAFGKSLPAVGGSEGVAKVVAVGPNVTNIKPNAVVVSRQPLNLTGSWSTHLFKDENDLIALPKDTISMESAATLSSLYTAIRLLNNFVNLEKGDVIIQDGAAGSIGQCVIQLAKARGIKTINIIRNSRGAEDKIELLKSLGGDVVVVEEYVRTADWVDLFTDLPAPKLGLDSIGSKVATNIARSLQNGGTMVCYGGQSNKGIQLPSSILINKNITLKGFNLQADALANPEKHQAIHEEAVELLSSGKVKIFAESFKFENIKSAIDKVSTVGKLGRKIILDFSS